MAPMARITFQALLDWFHEIKADRWHIHVQAAQFDAKEYLSVMSPATGMIVLNISGAATRDFQTDDEGFSFKSRFQGKEIWLEIPYTAVMCAVDPRTGIPNLFPYFEDYGDLEPEPAVNTLTIHNPVMFKQPTLGEMLDFNKAVTAGASADTLPVIEEGDDGVIRVNFRQRGPEVVDGKDPFFNPGKDPRVKTADLFQFPGGEKEQLKLTHDSIQTKIGERKWSVIKGGKTVEPKASMPFIDHIYREKQERRKAKELAEDRYTFGNEKVSTAPIRSDGSEGKSVFFPDLDVSKVVWPPKKIARPDWMTVINGDKV